MKQVPGENDEAQACGGEGGPQRRIDVARDPNRKALHRRNYRLRSAMLILLKKKRRLNISSEKKSGVHSVNWTVA